MKTWLLQILFLLCFCSPLSALEGNKYVTAEIISRTEVLQPDSEEHLIAVKFEIADGWHIYWRNSGEAAIPTTIKWILPNDWQHSDNIWPSPYRFKEAGDITTFGYKEESAVFLKIHPEETPNGTVEIQANLKWLVCKEICVPGAATVKTQLAVNAEAPQTITSEWTKLEKHLATTPALSSDGLKVAVSPTKLSSQSTGFIRFDHPNLNLSQVQVFPYSNERVDFGTPVHNNESLYLPFTTRPSPNEGAISLEGIVTFPEKTLPWKSSFNLTEGEKASVLPPEDAANIPLFRYIDPESRPTQLVDEQSFSILSMITYALLAGIILNFMPCVLPVVSIKLFSLIESSKKCRATARRSVLFYSLGIISSMLAIAAVVVALKGVGGTVGWGFQFQSPAYVLTLLFVVFLFALSFFDLYQFRFNTLTKACSVDTSKHSSSLRDFFDGILTTALSTPCSAPLLGSVVAFALKESALTIGIVFLFIGVGLSLPYALIALSPKLIKVIPKPGNWMLTFKKVLGFILLATCLWLYSVLVSLVGPNNSIWALAILLFTTFSFWLLKQYQSKVVLIIFGLLNIAALFHYWPTLTDVSGRTSSAITSEKIDWVPFDLALLTSRTENSPAMFIDFTADWCITCKATEKAVIETDSVSSAITDNKVLAVKADWTTGDEEVTKGLKMFGAAGVPLFVYYPPGESKPEVLPTLLTKTRLLEALNGGAKSD